MALVPVVVAMQVFPFPLVCRWRTASAPPSSPMTPMGIAATAAAVATTATAATTTAATVVMPTTLVAVISDY